MRDNDRIKDTYCDILTSHGRIQRNSGWKSDRIVYGCRLFPLEYTMKHQLEQRLNELRSEFESGQKALADIEHQQANLRSSLLRISSAVQVLKEELDKYNGDLPDQQILNETSEPVKMEIQPDTG